MSYTTIFPLISKLFAGKAKYSYGTQICFLVIFFFCFVLFCFVLRAGLGMIFSWCELRWNLFSLRVHNRSKTCTWASGFVISIHPTDEVGCSTADGLFFFYLLFFLHVYTAVGWCSVAVERSPAMLEVGGSILVRVKQKILLSSG